MVQNFCQCKQGLKHLTEGRCTHLFTPRFNMNGRKKLTVYFPLFRFFSAKKHVAAFQQQFHWFSPPALPYLPLISLAVLHELWGVWSHKNNIFEKLLSKTFWRKSIFTPLPHVKLKRANPELLPCSAVLPPYEWKICPPHSKGAGVFHIHIYDSISLLMVIAVSTGKNPFCNCYISYRVHVYFCPSLPTL